MGIATEEQSKRMADAIARDADRPLVERLRDPKNHYPAALRLEAAKRIAEIEDQQKRLLWEKALETVRANKLERRVATQRRRITALIALARRLKT